MHGRGLSFILFLNNLVTGTGTLSFENVVYLQNLHFYLQSRFSALKDIGVILVNQIDRL